MSKNPFTTDAFADWCEKQPADKEYEWENCSSCACGQYASHFGLSRDQWIDALADDSPFWLKANGLAFEKPRTFGALAARLRSLSA